MRIIKTSVTLVCWVGSLLCCLGCPVFADAAVSVTDFVGRKVELQQPAQRIVSLAPHITENIFSAGAGDLLVGTLEYSDYPEAAKAVPRIGGLHGISIESIVAMKPDLVLAWASGHSSDIAQRLMALGLTVYLDEPRQLDDIAKSIRDIGALTGRDLQASGSAKQFIERLQQLRQQYSQRDTVSMLYQVWNEPLQTLNGEHIISDVMKLCGGENSFADAAVIAPRISVEAVIKRNPDVIVASGVNAERPDWLDAWLRWPVLTAVQNQHVFFIPPDILQRHTVRILDGADMLCHQLDQVRQSRVK